MTVDKENHLILTIILSLNWIPVNSLYDIELNKKCTYVSKKDKFTLCIQIIYLS